MIIQNEKVFESAKKQFEQKLTDEQVKHLNEIIYNILVKLNKGKY